jgi:lipopolysaccharide/colanic/teichoic acid biosynthesis glycosyltransferase
MVLVFWSHGRYDLENCLVGHREYAQIAHAVGYGVILAMGLSYFAHDQLLVSRSWLVLMWVFSILLVAAGRFMARRAVFLLHRQGFLRTRVIIVGASAVGVGLAEQFRGATGDGIDVVGFVDEFLPLGHLVVGVPVIGRPVDLVRGLDPTLADEYILVAQAIPHERLQEIFRRAVSTRGPVVRMAVSSMDVLTHGLVIAERSNVPLLTLQRAKLVGMDRFLKRLVDVVLACLGLVILLPIAAFLLLRSAYIGRGPLWTRERIWTAGGRVATVTLFSPDIVPWLPLRGAPALLSVLKGDIGLVGPRPRRWQPDQSESASPTLTMIAPGLTGPWRLAGPHTGMEEQDLADLTYVRSYSIWEDLRILWHTACRLSPRCQRDERLGRWHRTIDTHAERPSRPFAVMSDVSSHATSAFRKA